MRSTIMLMTLAVALGTSPTYLFAQAKADTASQDKMSNEKGGDQMSGQDKMDDEKSGDHMDGSDNMSKDKKHKKKNKNSDAMSSGSH